MEKTEKKKLTPAERARRREFTSRFWRGNRWLFVLTLAALALDIVGNMMSAEMLSQMTNAAAARSWAMLIYALKIVVVYFFMSLFAGFLRRYAHNRFAERAMRQYKEYAFSRVLKKSIGSFSREAQSDYISALTNDAAQIEEGYVRNLAQLVYYVVLLGAAVSMLFWYSWKVALATVALCAVQIAVSMAFGDRLVEAERRVSEKNSGFVGLVKDLLSGFSVIKSFRAEREVAEKFDENSADLEREKRRRKNADFLIGIVCGHLAGVVQVGAFAVAVVLAIGGEIDVGVSVATIQLLNYITQPINNIPNILAKMRASLGLVDKLAAACDENEEAGGTKTLENIGKGIRFEDVSFAYEPGKPVLKDISVEFESGKSYAVVGASGSGKSTLLNLLLGYRDDYSGEIHIDGEELRDLSLESLYDTVSVIQQNVFVFNSSIEENITMFKDFPPERVALAEKNARLDALIAEKGSGYLCGENGAGLSGGERQRISIARSLLRGAPVLLMDEATAALDAETAYGVEDAILSIDQLTRIIVTHRLERPLLERYDEIVVMSGGRVVEKGCFEELLGRDGYFRALYSVAHAEELLG